MATVVDSFEMGSGPGSGPGSSPGSDPGGVGLGSRLSAARAGLASVLDELDPDRLTGADATLLYGEFVAAERLCVAGKTLLAPRIEASNVWKEGGHSDAASMLALVEGVSPGQARATLANGRHLDDLPATEEALRHGDLSAAKLTELCGAGALDPDRESELVDGAAEAPLAQVKERCRASRATSAARDPKATTKRIRAGRFFSWWTDEEGAFCYKGRDTADRGAAIRQHLGHAATVIRRDRRARAKAGATQDPQATGATGATPATPDPDDEGPISQGALWADAFFTLVTQQGSDPVPAGTDPAGTDSDSDSDSDTDQAGTDTPVGADFDQEPTDQEPADQEPGDHEPADPPSPHALSVITRPPTCTTIVVVDIEALLRGEALPGERCEIDGQGPIPVPMARDLANDSFLAVLFHRAGDIRAVSHRGRTINAALRTALVYRDRTCVVPGCGVTKGLEIDHVIPFAEGGPTELDNLALLCYDHHHKKTYEGWVLTRTSVGDQGRATWTFEPQPPFGQEPGLGLDTDEGRAEWRRRRE